MLHFVSCYQLGNGYEITLTWGVQFGHSTASPGWAGERLYLRPRRAWICFNI